MTEIENPLLEEIAGKPYEGTPLTPEQDSYLKNVIDPHIQKLIDDMELEKVRRQLHDEQLRKTYV